MEIIRNASALEITGSTLFALAILHTFLANKIHRLGDKFTSGSPSAYFFHLLGEVEVVFGIWALALIGFISFQLSSEKALAYLETRNYTEPVFVFVIMAVCSTRPILQLAETLIDRIAGLIPISKSISFLASALIVGPLLGSFITEPAAMTVTALILSERYFKLRLSLPLRYAILGSLFVNISIGGVLTPYAAPPVLMVAKTWNWDFAFMIENFGWKAILAVFSITGLLLYRHREELKKISFQSSTKTKNPIPIWVTLLHLFFLAVIVMGAHHLVIFFGAFLFFLGTLSVTREYQSSLKLKEPLLVSFFLLGIVVLGGVQGWWLSPLLSKLEALPLFLGSIILTAFTDNAALTYLGSQVQGLSDASKYALLAGAVAGGGLTVIANAPNPAGYGILKTHFGAQGISPLGLAKAALIPTLIGAAAFWFL